jgi:hypothetical protein
MVLVLALLQSHAAPEVVLSRAVFEQLVAVDEPEQPVEPPGPVITRREVVVVTNGANLTVFATWDLSAARPGWVDLPLAKGSWHVLDATVDGRPARIATVDGTLRLVRRFDADARVRVRLQQRGSTREGATLSLLEAPVGTVEVRTNDAVQQVESDAPVVRLADRWGTGAGTFTVTTEAVPRARRAGQEVVGAVGIGVTVRDDVLRTKARVAYRIGVGRVETVAFRIEGAGADLEVTGPLVDRWSRTGDRVEVVLTRPEDRLVELEVSLTTALPDADQAKPVVPVITPLDTYRNEAHAQLARDGDREIVAGMAGWTAVASSDLPPVARGLVEGTPMSAWSASRPEATTLDLLRFEPVSGPATLVDVAAWYGALSHDGRTLLRGHLTVRNDRGDFLRMRLAPGQRLISARVGEEPAQVARDGDVLLIPLLKSLETVEGLLDFPVHVVVLGEGEPFARRDERVLPWPSVDAPVAVTRVELALPPGFESRLEAGESHVVDAFSEGDGISYGFKAGDGDVARADALYQDALSAYMKNDFASAQSALDGLRDLGAANENVSRLQSNLDVVFDDGETDDALGRRVKDQARARAVEEERRQVALEQKADELLDAGDYEAAEKAYDEALQIGGLLEKLEQSESREVQKGNASVSLKRAKAKKAKERRAEAEVYTKRTTIDFDDVEVSGELEKPAGFVVIDLGGEEDALEALPEPEPIGSPPVVLGGGGPDGVEGGVVDGVEGPVLERVPAPTASQEYNLGGAANLEDWGYAGEPPAPELEDRPVSGTFGANFAVDPVDEARPRRSRQRPGGLGRRKVPTVRAGKSVSELVEPPAPPPAPPPPPVVPAFEPLEVTAASRDIVVPTFGEVVRYQHLILPRGAAPTVRVVMKAPRGER